MQLAFSQDELRPLVAAVVAEMLDTFGNPNRLVFPEAEAAELMGVRSHVLRDARLRGELTASKVGRGFSFTRAELVRWLESRRNKD